MKPTAEERRQCEREDALKALEERERYWPDTPPDDNDNTDLNEPTEEAPWL